MPSTAAKRKLQTKASQRARTIKYECRGGFCRATPRRIRLKKGQTVNLAAINVDVTIDFIGSSPFRSGTDPISINKGSSNSQVVANTSGQFDYTLTCRNPNCPSQNDPPTMIVE
jgi:hypothetical protein